MRSKITRRSFFSIAVAAAALFSCSAFAQTPAAAPPAPAPAATVVAPAPVVPAPASPAPAVPAPAAIVAPAPVRRPEDETPTPHTQGNQPAPVLASRVTAMLAAARGTGQPVQIIAERDRTIADLRGQVATLQQQLNAANTELGTLRQERQQIEQALAGLQANQQSVAETVASLGFEPQRLPAPEASASNPTSGAEVYAEWKRLQKEEPTKARAYADKHMATLRAYASSQPQTIV